MDHGLAQPRGEDKALTTRNHIMLVQCQAAGEMSTDGDAFDGSGEPVAHPRNGDDAFSVLLAQRSSKPCECGVDDVSARRTVVPHGPLELVAGDDLARVTEEYVEHFERSALDLRHSPGHSQLETPLIELGGAEPIPIEREPVLVRLNPHDRNPSGCLKPNASQTCDTVLLN